MCCGGGENEDANEFKKGGDNDLSEGPIKSRGCTDILCLPLFAAAQVIFIIVTIAGLADGDPSKLYKPRDFRGSYCGVETNWNGGPNTMSQTKLSYTMNVSSTVDIIFKQTLCSSAVRQVLTEGDGSFSPLLDTQAKIDEYLCDCCLVPCTRCEGQLDNGGDLASSADLLTTVSSRMSELTDPDKAGDLFSPSGSNGNTFSASAFWEQATKYFNQVCLPACSVDVANSSGASRSFLWAPTADLDLYDEWMMLSNAADNAMTSAVKSLLAQAFTFSALPESVCPYRPEMCVPFPGIDATEVTEGSSYCTFALAAGVVDALGSAASSAFATIGLDAFSSSASESFGDWVGDFQQSLDTFVLTAFVSFVLGLVFLVLLRFFIGICVWIAVFCTILAFFFGGGFLFVLSGQCAGTGLLETGKQVSVAVVVAGQAAATNAITGESVSEALTGDGADYRGRQERSKYGKKCLTWETQTLFPAYRASNYTALSPATVAKNYCRNPYKAGDANKAKTIWCITSDPAIKWEECLPIGVIQPECPHGYAISGKTMREALYYSSCVVWVLGILWVVIILIFVKRIRLAIALNKVAAEYLACNPSTLLIPVAQAIVAIIWGLLWFLSASFLLSQVPDSYTPTGYFASYSEAFGTASACAFWETGPDCQGTPGACTDKWPTGSVWKDSVCDPSVESGPAKCWRCAPPRYVFDLRFAVSFFVFLWNNAFNVALGQMLIAMAVGMWFFLKAEDKGKTFVVWKAVKTVFRYHLGTVAFGSFIIAVIQFIRYLMKYFEKQAGAQKNRVMVLVLKVLQCCIWCFEKCVKFLNKNAYIQTALMGTNFCTSAKKAFHLILRNILRFGTMAVLGNVIYGIGFVCITVGTTTLGYLFMRAMHPDVSPFMPLICFAFVSYVVAKLYMSVFGLAVDTCLQCFLACEEMGLSGDFVPSCLKGFIDDSDVKGGDMRKKAW